MNIFGVTYEGWIDEYLRPLEKRLPIEIPNSNYKEWIIESLLPILETNPEYSDILKATFRVMQSVEYGGLGVGYSKTTRCICAEGGFLILDNVGEDDAWWLINRPHELQKRVKECQKKDTL